MIKELVNTIQVKLSEVGLDTRQVDFKELVDRTVGALQRPAVNISINSASFDQVTLNKYKAMMVISLYVLVQNLKGEKFSRENIYELLEGLTQALTCQKFDLDLQDAIRPSSWSNVTDKVFADAGYEIYQMNFMTSYIFTKSAAAEDGTDDLGVLERIVNKYFLQPDDGVEDAEGIVLLNQVAGGNAYTKSGTGLKAGRARTENEGSVYGGKAGSTS
jgi:hypothetical protein